LTLEELRVLAQEYAVASIERQSAILYEVKRGGYRIGFFLGQLVP